MSRPPAIVRAFPSRKELNLASKEEELLQFHSEGRRKLSSVPEFIQRSRYAVALLRMQLVFVWSTLLLIFWVTVMSAVGQLLEERPLKLLRDADFSRETVLASRSVGYRPSEELVPFPWFVFSVFALTGLVVLLEVHIELLMFFKPNKGFKIYCSTRVDFFLPAFADWTVKKSVKIQEYFRKFMKKSEKKELFIDKVFGPEPVIEWDYPEDIFEPPSPVVPIQEGVERGGRGGGGRGSVERSLPEAGKESGTSDEDRVSFLSPPPPVSVPKQEDHHPPSENDIKPSAMGDGKKNVEGRRVSLKLGSQEFPALRSPVRSNSFDFLHSSYSREDGGIPNVEKLCALKHKRPRKLRIMESMDRDLRRSRSVEQAPRSADMLSLKPLGTKKISFKDAIKADKENRDLRSPSSSYARLIVARVSTGAGKAVASLISDLSLDGDKFWWRYVGAQLIDIGFQVYLLGIYSGKNLLTGEVLTEVQPEAAISLQTWLLVLDMLSSAVICIVGNRFWALVAEVFVDLGYMLNLVFTAGSFFDPSSWHVLRSEGFIAMLAAVFPVHLAAIELVDVSTLVLEELLDRRVKTTAKRLKLLSRPTSLEAASSVKEGVEGSSPLNSDLEKCPLPPPPEKQGLFTRKDCILVRLFYIPFSLGIGVFLSILAFPPIYNRSCESVFGLSTSEASASTPFVCLWTLNTIFDEQGCDCAMLRIKSEVYAGSDSFSSCVDFEAVFSTVTRTRFLFVEPPRNASCQGKDPLLQVVISSVGPHVQSMYVPVQLITDLSPLSTAVQLTHAVLTTNDIISLPPSLARLPSLESLDLRLNRISEVPEDFSQFSIPPGGVLLAGNSACSAEAYLNMSTTLRDTVSCTIYDDKEVSPDCAHVLRVNPLVAGSGTSCLTHTDLGEPGVCLTECEEGFRSGWNFMDLNRDDLVEVEELAVFLRGYGWEIPSEDSWFCLCQMCGACSDGLARVPKIKMGAFFTGGLSDCTECDWF